MTDDPVRPHTAPHVGADNSVRPHTAPHVGADDSVRPRELVALTKLGKMVDHCINEIPTHHPSVSIHNYVIMPNHIHMMLELGSTPDGQSRPSLQKIMQGIKSITTRYAWSYGLKDLWQRSYHDHIIRNEADYRRIWNYIETNPLRWTDDMYYSPDDTSYFL
ncbi:MAG: transposase [Oscillospiraceae bacterium]|nr:transposase [Oscillospiraceae bacterium]